MTNQIAMSGDNKLTFDPPTHLPELTLNFIRSSRCHSTPSLKISGKSVQSFAHNVADKVSNQFKNNTNRPVVQQINTISSHGNYSKFRKENIQNWQKRDTKIYTCKVSLG